MATKDRTLSQRSDGKWADKRDGVERAASLHTTQKAAAQSGKEHVLEQGGGELKIKDDDETIRQKYTICRRDPYSPQG